MKVYLVGGAVRDRVLGKNPKDLDFVVLAPSFEDMVEFLEGEGCKIHVKYPQFGTLKAKHPAYGDCDFALPRSESSYTDGRRPDSVSLATLDEDLSRRDFTMNAMAQDVETGEIHDPFGGKSDMDMGLLVAVGDTQERMVEDPLRLLRAFRFSVTMDLYLSRDLDDMLDNPADLRGRMSSVSSERVREEFFKASAYLSPFVRGLAKYPYLVALMEERGISLVPSLSRR